VADFGLRDLRAKGATDEYRAGRALRELQHLLGPKSIRTTEIYIKQFVAETVRPNVRPIVAEAGSG
jgi:site-specific recombinase XerD